MYADLTEGFMRRVVTYLASSSFYFLRSFRFYWSPEPRMISSSSYLISSSKASSSSKYCRLPAYSLARLTSYTGPNAEKSSSSSCSFTSSSGSNPSTSTQNFYGFTNYLDSSSSFIAAA
jgi:hypothetical protein